MNFNASDYQRVRLWSGIFSIGTNLGLIWAFYVVSLLAPATLQLWSAPLLLLVPVAAMLALGLVFDVLSGWASERALGRTRQTFKLWLRDWFLVALRIAPALYVGLLALGWLRLQRWPAVLLFGAGAALVWALLTLFLPQLLPRAWRADSGATRAFEAQLRPELTRLQVPSELSITWIESEDETTVNGAMLPLGGARIWLASNVARQLTPRQAALLVRRDYWFEQTRKTLWETLICIGWLALGLVGARLMPADIFVQGALGGAAWMTSWCFAALFVWPRLNSAWVRGADRELLKFADADEIETLLRRVQSLNASDIQLPDAKAGVFHPIPELERRLANLKS